VWQLDIFTLIKISLRLKIDKRSQNIRIFPDGAKIPENVHIYDVRTRRRFRKCANAHEVLIRRCFKITNLMETLIKITSNKWIDNSEGNWSMKNCRLNGTWINFYVKLSKALPSYLIYVLISLQETPAWLIRVWVSKYPVFYHECQRTMFVFSAINAR